MSLGKPELEDVVYDGYFKRVKEYLTEHGPAPSVIISEATGVPIAVIDHFLRQGRIEIPEGEEKYIPCERCGGDIRYGRFCPKCAAEIGKELQVTLTYGEIGEVPKRKKEGKMRYFGVEKK